MKYLALYCYPQDLRRLLVLKEQNISGEKERLDIMLKADIDNIHNSIANCQRIVDEFKSKGLQTREELEAELKEKDGKDAANKDAQKALKALKNPHEPYLNKEYIYKNAEILYQVK